MLSRLVNHIRAAVGYGHSHHEHKPVDTKSLRNVRALFILKRREDYSVDLSNFHEKTVATGMWHSAGYVADMLTAHGAATKVIVVTDNNDIDREVSQFQATHVFIEGYWVVPEKFDILKQLHPGVTWVVRCHSEIAFLAGEGIALAWTSGYLARGVYVAGNSPRNSADLSIFALGQGFDPSLVAFLPNSYPVNLKELPDERTLDLEDTLSIGCFGAIRPLKNQLTQAIAAYAYAHQQGKYLKFYINAGRIEMSGLNTLKNLRSFFDPLSDAELIEIPWCSSEDFLAVLAQMDVSLQVSFTETFNLVSADALRAGTPIVTSTEVPFATEGTADPTSVFSIVEAIGDALENPFNNVSTNRATLRQYVAESAATWYDWLK